MQCEWLTRRVSAILILSVVAGCGQGDGPGGSRDSSGSGAIWSLSEQPIFSVSESSADPAYILYQAWSGLILDDGSVVIANAGDRHLIFLDSLGTALRVVGGAGGGPGEFAGQMWVNGETESGLTIREAAGRRISHFTRTGDFINSFSIPSPPGGMIFGYLAGSGTVASELRTPAGESRVYNVFSDSATSVAVLSGAPQPPPSQISWQGVMDLSDLVPPSGVPISVTTSGPREITINTSLPPACAATSREVTIGAEVFAMDAVNGVITAHTVDGGSRVVFTATERVSATAELHDTLERGLPNMLASSSPIPADTIASALERLLPVGALLPAWTSMIADPSGRLWLRMQECPGLSEESEEYQIITVSGEDLGKISVSGSRRVYAVRGDRVLIARTDDLGIEHIELYRLEDPAGS